MSVTMSEPTLYERLGGSEAISAVVDTFYQRVLADDRLRPLLAGRDLEALRRHQTRFLSYAFGGPNQYKGRNMQRAHAGLGITEAQFGAVAGHLQDALNDFDVPRPWIDEIIGHVGRLQGDVVGQ